MPSQLQIDTEWLRAYADQLDVLSTKTEIPSPRIERLRQIAAHLLVIEKRNRQESVPTDEFCAGPEDISACLWQITERENSKRWFQCIRCGGSTTERMEVVPKDLTERSPDLWVCWLGDPISPDFCSHVREVVYQHAAAHNADPELVEMTGRMEVRSYYSKPKWA